MTDNVTEYKLTKRGMTVDALLCKFAKHERDAPCNGLLKVDGCALWCMKKNTSLSSVVDYLQSHLGKSIAVLEFYVEGSVS